ncbi:MAG: putative tau-tubulin kinase 2, partial [Streblomastix strix]
MAKVDLTPRVGDIVNDSYELVRKINRGKKRIIFYAIDKQMYEVALKLEKEVDGQTAICIESAIIKTLSTEQIHIPKFYKYGSYKNYKFLAQELLGPNMIALVNYKKPYKFSLHTVLKFGIQAIETIQIVHNKGFVHRNIKPGNFLIGNSLRTSGTFYLTNFGLCKILNKIDNVVVKPTFQGRFRGSMTYASLNAHNLVELGRQDDLISLLYILVEFYNGMLPWSDVDNQKTQTLKEQFHDHKLLEQLPKQFLEFESYILSLDYTTDPDYAYLISLLNQAAVENNIDLNAPFEWEEEINNERSTLTQREVAHIVQINKTVQELEQKKKQIDQVNSENKIEQIEQIEKEINQQKQFVLNPQQLRYKLISLNIIHRLQKKYIKLYNLKGAKNSLQQQSQKDNILLVPTTSHIHAVKSIHYSNNLAESNSKLSITSPIHSPVRRSSLNNNQNNDTSLLGQYRRSSILQNSQSLGKSSTVQELIDVLDALTGAKEDFDENQNEIDNINEIDNKYEVDNQQQSQSPVRQDNYVEQFIDGMKKKDDKYNQFDWASFVEQTGGSHQNEGFDGIDISEYDDLQSDANNSNLNSTNSLQTQKSSSKSLSKKQSEFEKRKKRRLFVVSQNYSNKNKSSNEQKPLNSLLIDLD